MSSVKLKHASGNGAILHAPAANPSNDVTLKVPSTTGSAGQFLRTASSNHSATNAELEWATPTDTTTPADNTVTAAKTDLSIVSGDIIYGNGTDSWARLPKGSNDQVLTLASGVPSWAAASGGTFSKAFHDTGNTQTTVNKDNDSPAVRVGGTGLELEITPPDNNTSYLILIRTAVHTGNNDGQWGMKLCYSTDNWSSQSNLTFMHNSYGYETTTKTRYNINTWQRWKPGSTSTYKIGLFAEVWSTDSIELTFNGHSGESSLTAFEISDATKKVGDWG